MLLSFYNRMCSKGINDNYNGVDKITDARPKTDYLVVQDILHAVNTVRPDQFQGRANRRNGDVPGLAAGLFVAE